MIEVNYAVLTRVIKENECVSNYFPLFKFFVLKLYTDIASLKTLLIKLHFINKST